jgi:hypothetical protein
MILEIPKGAYNPCFTGEVACGNRATPVAPASHRRQTHPSLCLLVCDPALGSDRSTRCRLRLFDAPPPRHKTTVGRHTMAALHHFRQER